MICEGCGNESFHWVCMPCVKARAKAAMTKKCTCGKQKRPVFKKTSWRAWESCLRCLGTIRQLPDPPRGMAPTTVDVGTITEYGLTQKLTNAVRCY